MYSRSYYPDDASPAPHRAHHQHDPHHHHHHQQQQLDHHDSFRRQQQQPNHSHGGTHNPHHSNDFYEDDSEIYIDSTYHGIPQQHRDHHGAGPPPPPPPRVSRMQPHQQQQHLHQQTPPISTTPRPMTPNYHRPHTTTPSEYSSVSKTKSKNKNGVVIETMRTPMNPCCPDSKGTCCILLLLNLGLLLVTLGFSIVLQLFEPPFVWYCGLLFLIVGFIALIVSLLFCMRICRYSNWSSARSDNSGHGNGREPSELYWTHHWQKRINLPSRTSHHHNNMENSDIVFHSSDNNNSRRGLSPSS